MTDNHFPYNFTIRDFTYNNVQYRVALTPELYPDEDGLDFTGNYCCVLISSAKGTKLFELLADPDKRWESEPKGVDPGLIDELDKIIQEIRAN